MRQRRRAESGGFPYTPIRAARLAGGDGHAYVEEAGHSGRDDLRVASACTPMNSPAHGSAPAAPALAAPALHRLHQADLERALRHHRRALTALRGPAFSALPPSTTRALVQQLQADCERLQAELHRRGAPDSAPVSAPVSAPAR